MQFSKRTLQTVTFYITPDFNFLSLLQAPRGLICQMPQKGACAREGLGTKPSSLSRITEEKPCAFSHQNIRCLMFCFPLEVDINCMAYFFSSFPPSTRPSMKQVFFASCSFFFGLHLFFWGLFASFWIGCRACGCDHFTTCHTPKSQDETPPGQSVTQHYPPNFIGGE